MKKIPVSFLCGAIAVLITVILYFTVIGNIFTEIICFITLVGVVFAEIVATLMAYFSTSEPRKVAAVGVVSLMIPISVVLSFVYIIGFPKEYGTYAGYYFSIFAVLMLIAAILWGFSGRREDDNSYLQNAKNNMLNMRKMVKSIMLEDNAKKYEKELSELEEKLRFSDDSVISEADSLIFDMLTTLQSNIDDESFDVLNYIGKIGKEIDRRNIFAKKTV